MEVGVGRKVKKTQNISNGPLHLLDPAGKFGCFFVPTWVEGKTNLIGAG